MYAPSLEQGQAGRECWHLFHYNAEHPYGVPHSKINHGHPFLKIIVPEFKSVNTLTVTAAMSGRRKCAPTGIYFNDMTLPFDPLFPALLLYSEVHYRFFRGFPSLLFKKEPEVLFDAAARIEPNRDLPVMLIINDIDLFPVEVGSVNITVSQRGSKCELFSFDDPAPYEVDHPMRGQQRSFIFPLAAKRLMQGELFINATVSISNGKRRWTVFNDNLNTSSMRAFRCWNSADPLPGGELCSYGDLHVHSQFSQSHVEFGPPLEAIDIMAHVGGLDFTAITDHSYDICCSMEDYLREDARLTKWRVRRSALEQEGRYSTILVPGEEVSCRNRRGEIVHLCVLGNREFIEGSADGARRNRLFTKDLTIEEVITRAHAGGAVAFAAHPCSRGGLLQKVLLQRGSWSDEDLRCPIDGIQPLNSGLGPSWRRGKAAWTRLLQQGIIRTLLAGNDAHGDFNRYRSIKKPFLAIYEDFGRYMGFARTGIYGRCATAGSVLDAIRRGATFITTGPYISINSSAKVDDFAIGATSDSRSTGSVYIHVKSSAEFGKIKTVHLFSVERANGAGERIVKEVVCEGNGYELIVPVATGDIARGSFLRAEAFAQRDDGSGTHAFSGAAVI